jgi:antitoxin component YwqK of YwqJK toxin-antitoxin module
MRSLIKKNRFNREGRKQGYWEDYYDNGVLHFKGSYKNGNRDGYWEYYYSNGNLWCSGSYKDSEMEGEWEFYWDNGSLKERRIYDNGNLIEGL